MPIPSRRSGHVASRILAISALLSLLFIAGCTAAGNSSNTVTIGPPAKLAFTVQPSSVAAGTTSIAPAVQVSVEDANGNVVASATNAVTIAIGTNPSTGTLGGTLTATPANGVATFSNLTISAAGAGYTLAASTSGLASATSNAFNVFGTPTKLAFAVQPTNVAAGSSITPAVQVSIEDANNSIVTSATNQITIVLGTNPSNGVLGGTLAATAVNGVATFSNLNINKVGTGYTLAAGATGIAMGATSGTFNVTPGAAAKLAFTVQPSNTTAGVAITPVVQVTVQDALGNTVTSATNAISIGSSTQVFGTASANAVNGVATFSNLEINLAGTGYTLTASATGLTGATSNTFNITVGTAAKLVFVTEPSNVVAGSSITPAVMVGVQDNVGNVVPTATNTITLAIGTNPSSATLGGTLAVAAVNGVATFSNLSINTSGTGYTLTNSSPGLAGTTSTAFNVTAGAAAKLAFAVQPSNVAAGSSITPAVTVSVEDTFGNIVTSATNAVSLAIGTNPSSGTLSGGAAVTPVNGVATFSTLSINKAGTGYTLAASATGVATGATSGTFNVTAGAAAQLAFTQQPSNVVAGSSITPAVTVTIEDANGNIVTGATNAVSIAIGTNAGGGTLSGGAAVTPVNGVATFAALSINKSGTGYTLAASATGVATGATSGTFNVTAGTATQLVFTQQPSTVAAGSSITPAVTVSIEDANGNVVTTATNAVSMAIGTNPSSGTLSGGAAVTPVNGVATFAALSITKAGTGYTLAASATGIATGATSGTFNVTPGAPAQLVFTQQPSNVVAGSSITPAVTVTIEDAEGNVVTTATNAVSMAIGTNAGSGTLSGGAAVTPANGVATFAALSINKAGTGYTLAASATGVATGATSGTFNVTAGAAAQLAFTQQPSNVVAGSSITPAVTVTIEDANGNVVTSATNTVSMAIGTNAGSGTLSGGAAVTPVNGVATFAALSINKSGTGYTLAASATGVATGATSGTFNVTAGTPSQLAFIQEPVNVVEGSPITPAVTVAVEDSLGNVVTTATNAVSMAIGTNPASGALSGGGAVSPVNGVATFANLSINNTGNGYTLTASATGIATGASSTSFNVIVSVGPAAKVAFVQQPTNVVAGSSITPAVTVAIEDASGNVVTTATNTVTISIGINPPGGTLGGTLSANAVSGIATFSNLNINRSALGYSLQAGATGLTSGSSTTFNVTAGTPSRLAFTQQPSNVVAGSSITPAVTVAIEDVLGNVVTSATNAVSMGFGMNPSGATLSGGAAVTPVSGVATFAALSVNKSGTGYTLDATATGLTTGGISGTFNVTAGTATQLVFTQQPSNVAAGSSITPAVTVAIEDALGNVVTTATNAVSMAIGTNPSSGSLSGGAAVTPVNGVATFAALSINKTGTGYTLAASATGIATGATSGTFNVTAGTPTQLVFTQQPSNVVAGSSITPAVTVTIEDANGNVVTGATNAVSMAIGTNAGSGTLSGGAAVTPVNGVATFAALIINKEGTGYTLAASATGVAAGATSGTFNVTAGTATQLVFTQQPTNVTSGSSISPAVTVSIEDSLGNVVTSATNMITVAIGTNPASGSLSGTLSSSAASGVATFSNLSINAAGTGYTLTATATGFTTITSSAFNVAAICTTNCTLSGNVSGPWVEDLTITLTPSGGGTAINSPLTSSTGAYSFSGLTEGTTYNVTGSAGYSYSPASITINGNVTAETITATPLVTSYSISGTVTYSGAYTGTTHNTLINVFQCAGCNVVGGTTLSTVPTAGGLAYTVRGLPAGTYIVNAEIDTGDGGLVPQGTGTYNASNPEGSYTANGGQVNAASNPTNINFAISDRTAPSGTALVAPTVSVVAPSNGTALIFYNPYQDNFGEEVGTSYKIYYGTSNTLAGASSVTIPAGNSQQVYVLSGLTNGTAYYFQISALNASGESNPKSSIFGPVTIGAVTGNNTLTGQLTLNGITPTGHLTVGVYSNTQGIYFETVPASSVTNPFTYTITGVPSGSYQLFAVLDQNNDGIIDAGDVTNFVGANGPPPVTVPSTGPTIALTAANATTFVTTNHTLFSGVSTYNINVGINLGLKLPISMTLFSGPNVAVPFDIASSSSNNDFSPVFSATGTPAVNDTYQFLVTFADGSTQVISAAVTGVLTSSPTDQFATNLQVVTTSPDSPTLPEFTWVDPTSPALYTLKVNVNGTGGVSENWNYPQNSNGLPAGSTSVVYNTDGNASPNSPLVPGETYDWSVTVQDANSNTATQVTTYTVAGTAPPTINKSFFPATIGTGGSATLNFFIQNPNGTTSLSGIGFTDAFPSGMQVGAVPGIVNNCGGTVNGGTAGSTSVGLSSGTLGAGGSCSFSINVTTTTNTGTFNNTTGAISSTQGGTGTTSNTATLIVPASGIAPPAITTSFNPNSIAVGGQSTISFDILNPNGSTTLTGVTFTDTLAGGLSFASLGSYNCGGTPTGATVGSTTVGLSGLTMSPNTFCTFSFNVTAASSGTINNTTSAISSTNGGTGTASNTATLTVTPLGPAPSVTGLSANSGSAGLSLTITGANFGASQGGSTVSINGSNFAVTGWSSTSITAIVPGPAGAGFVVVNVGSQSSATGPSSAFTVTAGRPTQLVFLDPVANTAAGSPIALVQVAVEDASGNINTAASSLITISIPTGDNPGSGTLSGTLSLTPSNGVAAFSNLSINNDGTGYELEATYPQGSSTIDGFSDSFSIISAPSSLTVTVPGPVIFANGNAENVTITVTNDLSGDVLTPTLTLNGASCSASICGTLGTLTGSAGSYSVPYTPPTSSNLTATTTFTLTVTSNLANSLPATSAFSVYPAGTRVVTVTGLGGQRILVSTAAPANRAAVVYNDTGGTTGATLILMASGNACPVISSANICGTLTTGTVTTGTTTTGTTGIPFTTIPFTYTAPATVPNPPYDRPMILAISNAEPSALGQVNFAITPTATTTLVIPNTSRLDSALTGAAIPLTASLAGDSGPNKTVIWTLTAGGAPCEAPCSNAGGTLSSPAYTRNGNAVTPTVTYTAPSTVPSSSANTPMITATSVDDSAETDNFSFAIVNGTCGSGNESILTGQYAFLVKGGTATGGYTAEIGSINADGHGNISSGLLDINRTTGVLTGLTQTGTYSIGSDNRGCMTLTNSNGGTASYRFALGTLSAGVATQGTMLGFNDDNGEAPRIEGILLQQNPSDFNVGSLKGTYVFGRDGVDAAGGHYVIAGLATADGVSNLTNISLDYDDAIVGAVNLPGPGDGTFTVPSAPGGRATFTTTIPTGTTTSVTNHIVAYIVSSSEVLSMSTDPADSTHAIQSGEIKLQSSPGAFTATTLDGGNYVMYRGGIDSTNGGNVISLIQATFSTNGNASVTIDRNDNGTETAEAVEPWVFTITSTGRTTVSGIGGSPIIYLVDSTQGFLVSALTPGTSVVSGYMQKQTPSSFSTSTLSGQYAVGGSASNTGTEFDTGVLTFTSGSISGTFDDISPDYANEGCTGNCGGLSPNQPIPGQGPSTITVSSTLGQILSGNIIGYIISPTKALIMQEAGTGEDPPELYILQQ